MTNTLLSLRMLLVLMLASLVKTRLKLNEGPEQSWLFRVSQGLWGTKKRGKNIIGNKG